MIGMIGRFLSALVAALMLALGPAGSTWAQEARPGQPIIIRWSTETEVNTAGYNVYRSEGEDGPWTRLNESLIPGASDPLRGGDYVYTDTNVIAGQVYWYELEEVETTGRSLRLRRTQATAGAMPRPFAAGGSCASILMVLGALGTVALGHYRSDATPGWDDSPA